MYVDSSQIEAQKYECTTDSITLSRPHFPSNTILISTKILNRIVRARNGNRSTAANLKVIHWNAGSRLWENKVTEIEALMLQMKPDLCFISEANLWDTTDDMDKNIPNYKLLLPNTMSNLKHARIILLVKSELIVHQLKYTNDEAAVIWVKIGDTRKNSLIVGGAYRQHHILGRDYHDSTWLDVQKEQEARWRKVLLSWKNITRNSKAVLLGDINLDHIRWDNPETKNEVMVENMKDIIETCGFVQLITQYTRSSRGTADSLLDHIWSNCQTRISNTFNISRGASDHNVVGLEISLRDIKPAGQNFVKRIWKKFNSERCLAKLKTYNWNEILQMTDVSLANSQLEEWLCEVMDTEAPMRIIQARTHFNNWITDDTKIEMRLRDLARDKARLTDLDSDWQDYRRKRNNCTARQKTDKTKHLKDLYKRIEEVKDSKSFFKTTRELLDTLPAGPPSSFHLDGRVIYKQKEMADMQAKFYADKVSKIKNELPRVNEDPLRVLRKAFSRWKPTGVKHTFSLKSITDRETAAMISKLSNSHAFGRDRLDAAIIKIAAPVITPVITHVIDLSLGTANFPQKWKLAQVLPILKGNNIDAKSPASYRPISLLPVISKLCERAAQTQMLHFLESSNQLHPDHHAYRTSTSTTTALIQMMDQIAEATDANLITATLALDLSAAFDCVTHKILHKKLEFYSFDLHSRNWIRSYLDHRSSYTVIGSAESEIKSSPHGVPQGSVLGPLLYLVYVNEMPSVTEDDLCDNWLHSRMDKLFNTGCEKCGHFTMYADDGLYGCCLFSTFVFYEESMVCYRRVYKGRFRRTHYPRFNRNSSAHLDELTLRGLLSISIKSQTRPTRANSTT